MDGSSVRVGAGEWVLKTWVSMGHEVVATVEVSCGPGTLRGLFYELHLVCKLGL